MSVDVAALRRRYKPERLLRQLSARSDAELVAADALLGLRRVLLDTTVYIHEVAGRLPQGVADLLDGTLRFHCSLCVSEIMAGLGRLHPDSQHYGLGWAHYKRLFSSVPANRLLTPDGDTLAQAGLISGVLARTQNHAQERSKDLFNDAAIYLVAAKLGVPLLTANRGDFDLIQQTAGQGRFVYYTAK